MHPGRVDYSGEGDKQSKQQASVAQPNGTTEKTRTVAQIKRHPKEHQPTSEELAALFENEVSKLLQKDQPEIALDLFDLSKQKQDEAGMEAEARKFDATPVNFRAYGMPLFHFQTNNSPDVWPGSMSRGARLAPRDLPTRRQ